METASLRRITVDSDPSAFPCLQGYLDSTNRVWWDVRFLYVALCGHGEKRRRRDWTKRCECLLTGAGLSSEFHFARKEQGSGVISDIMTSVAVVSLFALTVDKGLTDGVVNICYTYLTNSLKRALEVYPSGCEIPLGVGSIQLAAHGRVAGMRDLVANLPWTVRSTIQATWQAFVTAGSVSDVLNLESHALLDVLHVFVFLFKNRRGNNKHRLSTTSTSTICRIRDALLAWIARGTDTYIVEHYCRVHDIGKPAPALKQHDAAKRAYSRVHPEVIWSLFEEARRSSTSLEHVIKVRQKDQHVGCAGSLGDSWMNRAQNMYQAAHNVVVYLST